MLQIVLTFYYLSLIISTDSKKVVHIKETAGKHGGIHLSFVYQNRQLHLHLQVDKKLTNDHVPILVGEHHKIFTWNTMNENKTIYSDPQHEAYFVAEKTSNETRHKFHGMFQTGRSMNIVHPYLLDIKPMGMSARTLYVIEMDWVKPSKYDEDFSQRDYQSDWVYNLALNALHRGKLTYVVEMFVVIDNSIYQSWYDRSIGKNKEERKNNAIKQIQYYFFHVIRGVDLRYQSIKEPDYNISVRGAGIYVALTKDDAEWIEQNIYTTDSSGYDWVNASEALSDLDAWLDDYDYLFPDYDQATSFTRLQLAGGWNDDGSRKRLSGLANIKGVCGFWKGSVCRDAGLYAAVQTASHELGHSLGAPHDGDDNDCVDKDQYIMAGTPDFLSTENYLHPFTFSSCSIESMRVFLLALTFHGTNCLLDQTKRTSTGARSRRVQERTDETKLPGQLFSLDQQCKHVYDERSYFCKTLTQYYSVCRRLFCYNPHLGRCFTTSEQRAALGTPCEENKWCIHGDCVSTDVQPKPIDSCLSDDHEPYYGPTACQDMVKRLPYHCYNEPYKLDCCRECLKIADDSTPGCEYGDRELFCSTISASSCYDETTEEKCCKTCPPLRTGPPDCPYGDKATWCTTISQRECYANEETCCISCKQFIQPSNSYDCRYGDQSKWCGNIAPRQCYNIEERCCDTCQRYDNGKKGCNYGDRIAGCTLADCIDGTPERVKVTCCETCSLVTKPLVTGTTYSLRDLLPVVMSTTSPVYYGDTSRITSQIPFLTVRPRRRKTPRPRKRTGKPRPPSTTTTTSTAAPATTTITLVTTPTTPSTIATVVTTPRLNSNCKDTASWCRTMPTRDCYVSSDTCCTTCEKARIGSRGCKYGDRVGWCSAHVTKSADCDDHIVAFECCNTCRIYRWN